MPRKKTPPATDCFIFCPKFFDPADYPGPIAEHPDAAVWLLSTIFIKRVTTNHRARSSYVNLKAEYLAQMMGNKSYLRPIREALIAAGLIECDGIYARDRKPLGYRLTDRLLGPGIWGKYAVSGARFAKRVDQFRRGLKVECQANPLLQAHMHRWVKEAGFTPILDHVLDQIADHPFPEPKNGGQLEFPNRREFARAQATVIKGGFRPFKRDRFGRCHTPFSVLCGELRVCLQIGGEPLHEVDIACSQPFFLASLVCQNRGNTRQAEQRQGRRVHDSSFVPPDLTRMFDRVVSGQFYDDFMATGQGYPRDVAKRKVFQVIFGSTDLMYDSVMGGKFQRLYPSIFDDIVALKRDNPLVGKSPKPYAFVGRSLQLAESRVVIDTVAESLRLYYPSIPFLTVHDSILTPERHLSIVQGLLVDAFRSFPMQPALKIKPPRG